LLKKDQGWNGYTDDDGERLRWAAINNSWERRNNFCGEARALFSLANEGQADIGNSAGGVSIMQTLCKAIRGLVFPIIIGLDSCIFSIWSFSPRASRTEKLRLHFDHECSLTRVIVCSNINGPVRYSISGWSWNPLPSEGPFEFAIRVYIHKWETDRLLQSHWE